MTEIGALFTKKLDMSRAGIGGAMKKLMKLVESQDPPLHTHLVRERLQYHMLILYNQSADNSLSKGHFETKGSIPY